MTFIMPDDSEIEARAYQEADDDVPISDSTRYFLPVRSLDRSTWPDQIAGVAGLRARLERRPGSIRVTARMAEPGELAELWPIARRGLRGLPFQPPERAGIVVVDVVPG